MLRPAAHLLALSLLTIGTSSVGEAQTAPSKVRFWAVIDSARSAGGGCEAISRRLERRIRALPDSALEEFAKEWSAWWGTSYSWDLWGAAYVINGGSSDDGFEYFRGWLLSQGSERWAKASRTPDDAFDDVVPGTVAECEAMKYTLPTVYEERFHRRAPDSRPDNPSGRPWTEESLGTRFPRLSRRFGPGQ